MAAEDPRDYVVGLPVVITVRDSGRVSYWIDTAEAAEGIRDEYPNPFADLGPQNPVVVDADADAVEADHDMRAEASSPTADPRARMALHLDTIGQAMATMLEDWQTAGLPGDFLSGESYPFTESLDEVLAKVWHARDILREEF